MRTTLLCLTMMFALGIPCFAQDAGAEQKMSVGLGPELNMNSRENFAGALAVNFIYNLPLSLPFATGATITASTNFDGTAVLEATALFRWYFLGPDYAGLFAQADAGVFMVMEADDVIPLFTGGLRAGYRLPINDLFYAEFYGRGGYPFAFGIGAMVGVRF